MIPLKASLWSAGALSCHEPDRSVLGVSKSVSWIRTAKPLNICNLATFLFLLFKAGKRWFCPTLKSLVIKSGFRDNFSLPNLQEFLFLERWSIWFLSLEKWARFTPFENEPRPIIPACWFFQWLLDNPLAWVIESAASGKCPIKFLLSNYHRVLAGCRVGWSQQSSNNYYLSRPNPKTSFNSPATASPSRSSKTFIGIKSLYHVW